MDIEKVIPVGVQSGIGRLPWLQAVLADTPSRVTYRLLFAIAFVFIVEQAVAIYGAYNIGLWVGWSGGLAAVEQQNQTAARAVSRVRDGNAVCRAKGLAYDSASRHCN